MCPHQMGCVPHAAPPSPAGCCADLENQAGSEARSLREKYGSASSLGRPSPASTQGGAPAGSAGARGAHQGQEALLRSSQEQFKHLAAGGSLQLLLGQPWRMLPCTVLHWACWRWCSVAAWPAWLQLRQNRLPACLPLQMRRPVPQPPAAPLRRVPGPGTGQPQRCRQPAAPLPLRLHRWHRSQLQRGCGGGGCGGRRARLGHPAARRQPPAASVGQQQLGAGRVTPHLCSPELLPRLWCAAGAFNVL